MTRTKTKHAPTKEQERVAVDNIPIAIMILPNADLRNREKSSDLHVVKVNADWSATHHEDHKHVPMISKDDATRLINKTGDDNKRKAIVHMHPGNNEHTTTRANDRQDRPGRSDSKDDLLNDENRKPAATQTIPTPDDAPSNAMRRGRDYTAVLSFAKEHGHLNLPPTNRETRRLATWLRRRRNERKCQLPKGEVLCTTDAIRTQSAHSKLERECEAWDSMYKKLVAHYEKYGDFVVPIDDEITLHTWIFYQCQREKSKADCPKSEERSLRRSISSLSATPSAMKRPFRPNK